MKGHAFKAWREAAGLTQDEAAVRAGVSRKTVARAETGVSDIPIKLAAIASPDIAPDKGARAAKVAEKLKPAANVSPELRAAMLRNPPFAKTAAEAKAMRHLRAEQKGVDVATIRLLPLIPDWRRLESGRTVNAAIPDPLDEQPPAWAGPRGVLTKSGAVYDYEAAHQMKPPNPLGRANVTAGEW